MTKRIQKYFDLAYSSICSCYNKKILGDWDFLKDIAQIKFLVLF